MRKILLALPIVGAALAALVSPSEAGYRTPAVQPITCATHLWINTISANMVPSCTQPGVTDLAGLGTGVGTALGNNLNASGGLVGFSGSLGAASATSLVIGAGSAITSSGAGGALGSNAFTSTAYAPIASPTFTGTQTLTTALTTTLNGNTITTGTGTLTLGSVTLNAGAGGTLASGAFAAAAPCSAFGTAAGACAQGGVITGAGPTGGATSIPVITYNAAGQLTTVTSATPTVAAVNTVAYPSSYTSGGIPYASATGTIATSALLAANALVVGGGAGTAPATVTTGTGILTALGVNVGTAGAPVINGGALGTPLSGSAANLTSIPVAQATGVLPAANGGAGTISGALKGNGSGTVSQAACADLSNGATGCSAAFGAWSTATPTPTASTGTFTTATVAMTYYQVGKTVFLQGSLTITTIGSAVGRAIIPLPVNSAASPASSAVTAVLYGGGVTILSAAAIINLDISNNISIILGTATSGNVIFFSCVYQAS